MLVSRSIHATSAGIPQHPMVRTLVVVLVLVAFALAGCLGAQAPGDSERHPPELSVEATEPLNVTVVVFPSNEDEPVVNETLHLDLGDETTFGPALSREPHTFVLRVGDRTWSQSVEPDQHLTVRIDADGNVTVVSNTA